MSIDTHEIAKEFIAAGYSVIPIAKPKADEEGSGKRPPKGVRWREYAEESMTVKDVDKKFNGTGRMAIITGNVSGGQDGIGLEMIDVDHKPSYSAFRKMVEAKHSELKDKFIWTQTPNGYGLAFRVTADVPPSKKLAMAFVEVEDEGPHAWMGRGEYKAKEIDGKWYIMPCKFETRGNHAYYLTWPTEDYEILDGDYEDLQPISKEERDSLMAIAETFCELPENLKKNTSGSGTKKKADSASTEDQRKTIPFPGDIYNREVDFEELLEEYEWQFSYEDKNEGIRHFSRPGRKKKVGGSLFPDGKFHVFTSSAHPLEEGKQYTQFSMTVMYECEGDFSKGTKMVVDAGYEVKLTAKELEEILADNPDEVKNAYKRSGMKETQVSKVLVSLGIPLPPGKGLGRIAIDYEITELNRVVKECDGALASVAGQWGYYKYCERLGYVTEQNRFASYDTDSLELRAEQSLYCTEYTKKKGEDKATLKTIRTPTHVLRKIMNYPNSSAPVIKGFSQHPVVDFNGNLYGNRNGFQNGIMFGNCKTSWTADSRSFEECYNRIVELLCKDILFEDKKLGQALFVSMLMTGMARLGLPGGCPGYFVTANEPGTGKSTLFEMVSRVVYGQMVDSVDWGTDVNERRKEIISHLMEGIECFLFDNIKQGETVDSPILAQALSSGGFKNRILGKSEMVQISAQSLFVFIGNNLNMSTELSRRLMTIKLLANSENPAERKVSVVNVAKHCEQYRDEIINCLIKMLQEGVKMDSEIKKGSGFSFWDGVVRNPILVKMGVDIAGGYAISKSESNESNSTSAIIQLLATVFGANNYFTAREVLICIADDNRLSENEMEMAGKLRNSVEDECRQLKDELLTINGMADRSPKSMGRIMASLNNRISGEWRFVRHQTKSKVTTQYYIEALNEE